ncbi:phosphotransferase [Streptomyces sp. IB2014 016-6]|uniref:phosphotransferase n=1 Tax=Streptomyces sp. IB2014 016-6 TaxID=2517818 RepID=UPI0011C82EEC|nr:phosphotransferase [Streptomyces sp. IB2014 016-6]TXL91687.1 aminoglycoside phosphotransferase [Streptomyces sp. IB2014 016-6]
MPSVATSPPLIDPTFGCLPLGELLRRYEHVGEPMACRPLAQGLLNRGYRLTTTHGTYFLKHHLDGDRESIARQHRVTRRLQTLGVPVVPPVRDTEGGTVAVVGGHCYALHPWVDGRHRTGAHLTPAASWQLGSLLGVVHTCLEQVMKPVADRLGHGGTRDGTRLGARIGAQGSPHDAAGDGVYASAVPADTFALIDELLALARGRTPGDGFDSLAEHRLLERRTLLELNAHHQPPPGAETATGWVHGDFHPLNVLYRGTDPAAIVDWDRLAVQPRAEEAVRAAAIFFVRPSGELDLVKVRAYARAYRLTTGADPCELAAAVHRVWWERLNDFWILRWRYQLNDRRADPQFPAVSALAVWWTRRYEEVREAFAG